MLGFLRGKEDYVNVPEDEVIYEMAGSAAILRGDFKRMRNNPPFGGRQWRLYRSREDPAEVNDLSATEPQLMEELTTAYERFSEEVNFIEVPDDYDVIMQVQKNVARNQGKEVTDTVPILD